MAAAPDDLALVLRVVGQAPAPGPPDARLVVDAVGPAVPDRPPDFHGPYGDHWDDGTTHWFRHHWGLTARVRPPDAYIGGPVVGHERWITVRNSMLFVLARLLDGRGQFLLHGAAVRRGDTAVLIVGPSGAGKSSLAFAAHLAGWSVGGDDMVAVEPATVDVLVRGISRVPTLPGDVGVSVDGELLPQDPRDRRELTWFELDPRPAPLRAAVICGHDAGDGRLAATTAVPALEALVPALVLSALPGPVSQWFPVAARAGAWPVLRVGPRRRPSPSPGPCRRDARRTLGAVATRRAGLTVRYRTRPVPRRPGIDPAPGGRRPPDPCRVDHPGS